ncbi:hypothetical protein AB0C98_09105 [Streptomyces sp. NPDC048558]|uniref:hypothetical protein n=1 Tax=Streptomyces sp. NPDC048558 TaxID=3155759 RepID=UPI0034017D9C
MPCPNLSAVIASIVGAHAHPKLNTAKAHWTWVAAFTVTGILLGWYLSRRRRPGLTRAFRAGPCRAGPCRAGPGRAGP